MATTPRQTRRNTRLISDVLDSEDIDYEKNKSKYKRGNQGSAECHPFTELFNNFLRAHRLSRDSSSSGSASFMDMLSLQRLCRDVTMHSDSRQYPSREVQMWLLDLILHEWPTRTAQHIFEDYPSARSAERKERARDLLVKRGQRGATEQVGAVEEEEGRVRGSAIPENLTVHHYNDTSEQKTLLVLYDTLESCVLCGPTPTRIGFGQLYFPSAQKFLDMVKAASTRAEMALLLDYYTRMFALDLECCLKKDKRKKSAGVGAGDGASQQLQYCTLLGKFIQDASEGRMGSYVTKVYAHLMETMTTLYRRGDDDEDEEEEETVVHPLNTMQIFVDRAATNCALLIGMVNIVFHTPDRVTRELMHLLPEDSKHRMFMFDTLLEQARRLQYWDPLSSMLHKILHMHFTPKFKDTSATDGIRNIFSYELKVGNIKLEHEYLIMLAACALRCWSSVSATDADKTANEEDVLKHLRMEFKKLKSRKNKKWKGNSLVWAKYENEIMRQIAEK